MKYRSEKNLLFVSSKYRGLSLPEVLAALIILAFISSSVLVVVSRCMSSAADSVLRMQAFEVTRENMEKLLASDSVSEMSEYGSSDKYPEIQWQTVVETFYEPITARMWIQAICSAEYTDTEGEVQTVELTHWLTNLTKEQVLQIIEEKKKEKDLLAEAEQLVETVEEAAAYAGVDEETIEQWVNDGMPLTEDGDFIKVYLDLYEEHDGNPPPEAMKRVARTYAALRGVEPVEPLPGGPEGPGGPERPTPEGPTPDEPGWGCDSLPFCERVRCHIQAGTIQSLSFEEIMEYIRQCM